MTECAVDDEVSTRNCTAPGRFPTETCRGWYICIPDFFHLGIDGRKHFKVIEGDCPGALFFSVQIGMCVPEPDPTQNCVDPAQEKELEGTEISSMCTSQGHFAMPGCKDYFICSATTAGTYIQMNFSCASGLLYNERTGFCVGEQDAPESCTGVPIDESTDDCSSIGTFPTSGCSDFYTCVPQDDGTYIKMQYSCPDGLYFSQHHGHCVDRYDAPECFPHKSASLCEECRKICGEATTSISTPEYATSTTAPPEMCPQAGRFPVGDGCDSFYECSEDGMGGYYITYFNCSETTYFSQQLSQCTAVRPSHCAPHTTVPVTTMSPPNVTTTTPEVTTVILGTTTVVTSVITNATKEKGK